MSWIGDVYGGVCAAIRSDEVTYYAWTKYVRRSSDLVFPSASTDLLITGLGRSGNTFFSGVVELCYPQLSMVTHGHSIATLKRARRLGINSAITIRSPRECLSSRLVKTLNSSTSHVSEAAVARAVLDCEMYFAYLEAHHGDFLLFRFEDVTGHIARVMGIMSERFSLPLVSPCLIHEAAERTYQRLSGDTRSAYQRQLNNPDKDNLKRVVQPLLLKHRKWSVVQDLYDELIRKCAKVS